MSDGGGRLLAEAEAGLSLRRTPKGTEGREVAPAGAPPAGPEALLVQCGFDSGCPENHLGWGVGAVVINTDAQAPSPEMLGRAWASVLLKTRHFRVENYLPSPSPHFAHEELPDLNFPLAYKALHDLASPCPPHLS